MFSIAHLLEGEKNLLQLLRMHSHPRIFNLKANSPQSLGSALGRFRRSRGLIENDGPFLHGTHFKTHPSTIGKLNRISQKVEQDLAQAFFIGTNARR